MTHPNFNEFKNNRKIVYFLLFFGFVVVLFFFGASQAQAATYYVDKASIGGSCSDSNAGTSLTAPLCTIKQANQMVSPGDNVFIRAGTYTDNSGHSAIIDPRMSGSANNYITYKNYNGENVVIGGVYQPILLGYPTTWTRDYIIVDGIKVDGVSQASSPIDIFAFVYGNHNIIRNCVMQYTRINSDWWKGIYVYQGSSYNQIINNTIKYVGRLDPANQGNNIGDNIWIDGDHTLIEGNNISYCTHNCLELRGTYNIARNNDLHSNQGRTSDIQSIGTSNAHLVFENNIVRDSGGFTPGPCAAYGMQADSAYQIIRNNLFYNNHGHGLEIWGMAGAGTAKNSRVYNNVMFGNGNNINGDVPQNEGYGIDFNYISETNPGDFSGVVMKNNILYKNRYVGVNYKGSTDPSRHFEINNFEDTDGTPAFINEASYDFHLNSNSVCIDKGAWLTTTTSAGSGTNIPVTDAGYFIDGFGIVEGDTIQLQGQTNTARITSINYNTNTLTVNASLTWSSGQGIALSYSGSAPDIGAYEYIEVTPPADITAPVISAVSSSITHNSATITWTTNENSDSQVEYGLTISYGSQTTLDTSMVTSHSVLLSNLNASTIYHYRVKSKDAANNLATSSDYTFTTSAAPTLFVSLTVNPASGTAPLNGVDLTATVTGNVAGTINYTFYCNRTDSGTNITTPYAAKYDGVAQTTITGTDICSYSTAGTYTAKIIVERGSYQAEDRIVVNVSQQNYSPIGNVDAVDKNHITGWAYDQNVGTSPINVHIYIDGAPVANITANLSRPDIVGAGSGVVQDPNHGFDYTFQNLSVGTHTINVYAINTSEGTNPELPGSSKTVTVQPSFDTTPPSVSTNLTAIAVSSAQINLFWTASTDNVGVTGYRIYRGGTQIATSTTNFYQNTGLSSSTTYTYRVSAYDAANNESSQSTQILATTLISPVSTSPTTPIIPTTPIVPTGQTPPIAPKTTPSPNSSNQLIRTSSDTKVYEIINNLKHWIPSPIVFNDYGFTWNNISIVNIEEANNYTRVKLLKAQGDVKVYYLTESDMVRHIPNPEVFNSYSNNKWEDIIEVSQAEIDSYPINNLIKFENGTKVYKLENNTRRWIQTAQVFNRLKYDWNKIASVNQTELDYYVEGVSIK